MYNIYMDRIINKNLYEKAKKIVYKEHDKHSAYRSMAVMKQYKEMGGKLKGKDTKGGTQKWLQEKWKNLTPYVEGLAKKTEYVCGQKHPQQKGESICRPLKEIKMFDDKQLKKAYDMKQKGLRIDWKKL